MERTKKDLKKRVLKVYKQYLDLLTYRDLLQELSSAKDNLSWEKDEY